MKNQHTPFIDQEGNPKYIYDITYEDLLRLQEQHIEEGPYIEYKVNFDDKVRNKLARTITSFANDEGGWIFIGIKDNTKEIVLIDNQDYEHKIGNILNGSTSPKPKYITRFINYKDTEKGVLVIYIPEGEKPPYLAQGKIYSRYGSNSFVNEINDIYYIDKLYDKRSKKTQEIHDFCTREIEIVSKNYAGGVVDIYFIPDMSSKDDVLAEPTLINKTVIDVTSHNYSTDGKENTNFLMKFPLHESNCSYRSTIFRTITDYSHYDNTLIYEQYINGRAKVHIPLSYHEIGNDNERYSKLLQKTNYNTISKYKIVDGKQAIDSIFASIYTYFNIINSLYNYKFNVRIIIDINHVRRNILFFDNSTYTKYIEKHGLHYSEKDNYRIDFNDELSSTDIGIYNVFIFIEYVFNCFGMKSIHAYECYFDKPMKNLQRTENRNINRNQYTTHTTYLNKNT